MLVLKRTLLQVFLVSTSALPLLCASSLMMLL
jgi:hypothetical protein